MNGDKKKKKKKKNKNKKKNIDDSHPLQSAVATNVTGKHAKPSHNNDSLFDKTSSTFGYADVSGSAANRGERDFTPLKDKLGQSFFED